MPIYEYRCKDCNNLFEKITTSSLSTEEVLCEKCASKNVKKVISAGNYRLASSKRGLPAGSLSGCSTTPGFS